MGEAKVAVEVVLILIFRFSWVSTAWRPSIHLMEEGLGMLGTKEKAGLLVYLVREVREREGSVPGSSIRVTVADVHTSSAVPPEHKGVLGSYLEELETARARAG